MERVRVGVDLGVDAFGGVERVRVGVDLGVDALGGVERVRVGVDLGVDALGGVERVRVGVDLGVDALGGVERVRVGVDLGVDALGGVARVRVGVDFGVDTLGGVERVRVGVDLGADVRVGVERVRVGVAVRGAVTRSGRLDGGFAVRGATGTASRPRMASRTRRAGVGLRVRSSASPFARGAATRTGALSSAPSDSSMVVVDVGVAVRPPERTRTGFGASARRTSSRDPRRSVTPVRDSLSAAAVGELERVRTPPAVTPSRPDRFPTEGPPPTRTVPCWSGARVNLTLSDSLRSALRATKSVTSGNSLSEKPRRLPRRTCCTASGSRQFR
ncbi:MAG: hypothetical protein OXG74_17410 [Acidobacteria bacterium]|nr:hypothetical protein [Acidobacteriota bacterium]